MNWPTTLAETYTERDKGWKATSLAETFGRRKPAGAPKPARKRFAGWRIVASVAAAAAMMTGGAAVIGGPITSSATGVESSWAYVLGENYPLAVPPVIDGVPTPVDYIDSDLGDQDGLGANGVLTADSSIEASVAAEHAEGTKAICYIDAGTAENWRSDYGEFDPSELGGPDPGWPGEEFINVNDWATSVPSPYLSLEQIMTNRVALCKAEGFDDVELDNIDADTDGNVGFTVTEAEEITYVENLVPIINAAGLGYFTKNVSDQGNSNMVTALEPLAVGDIEEQCWEYSTCNLLAPFAAANKPILSVEYDSPNQSTICAEADAAGITTIAAGVDLTGPIQWSCSTITPTSGGTTTTTEGSTTSTSTTQATTTTTRAPTTTTQATTTTRPVTTTSVPPTTSTTAPSGTSTSTTAAPTSTTKPPSSTTTAPTTVPPTTGTTGPPETTSSSTVPPTSTVPPSTVPPSTSTSTTRPAPSTSTTAPKRHRPKPKPRHWGSTCTGTITITGSKVTCVETVAA